MTFIGYARMTITMGLLVIVAFNAHWSVTLALFLLTLRHVIDDWNEYRRMFE